MALQPRGFLSCRTMHTLDKQRMYKRHGLCGCKCASETARTAWAQCSTSLEMTKKEVTLPLHVGVVGALTVPRTSFSHPVASSSCGVPFQSPPMHHGPRSDLMVWNIRWSMSRLHLAWMPTVSWQYVDPQRNPRRVPGSYP